MCSVGELEEKLNAILGNPQAMGQIMALAQSLGGGGNTAVEIPEEYTSVDPPENLSALPFGELDPRMMQIGMRLLQEYQREDERNTALLTALRPFVKEERCQKLDRAIQLARLARLIRAVLEELGKEGKRGV